MTNYSELFSMLARVLPEHTKFNLGPYGAMDFRTTKDATRSCVWFDDESNGVTTDLVVWQKDTGKLIMCFINANLDVEDIDIHEHEGWIENGKRLPAEAHIHISTSLNKQEKYKFMQCIVGFMKQNNY